MAITINIYYRGKSEDIRNFAKEMTNLGIVDKIRKSEGNLAYDYFLSFEDEGLLLLIDKWKNQKSLDLHHSSENMREIINLRQKYNLSMNVKRYVDSEEEIPEKDREFIL